MCIFFSFLPTYYFFYKWVLWLTLLSNHKIWKYGQKHNVAQCIKGELVSIKVWMVKINEFQNHDICQITQFELKRADKVMKFTRLYPIAIHSKNNEIMSEALKLFPFLKKCKSWDIEKKKFSWRERCNDYKSLGTYKIFTVTKSWISTLKKFCTKTKHVA